MLITKTTSQWIRRKKSQQFEEETSATSSLPDSSSGYQGLKYYVQLDEQRCSFYRFWVFKGSKGTNRL